MGEKQGEQVTPARLAATFGGENSTRLRFVDPVAHHLSGGRGTNGRISAVIKYVYEIDYPPRGKDEYLKWVRSIADALQAPAELRRLASYDNVYSMTPHRVVEFTFDSLQDAATYFDRKEIGLIVRSELPTHSANIRIKVLALRDDYIKATVAETAAAHEDQP